MSNCKKTWSTTEFATETRSEQAALELQQAHQHSSSKQLTLANHELHEGTQAHTSSPLGADRARPMSIEPERS